MTARQLLSLSRPMVAIIILAFHMTVTAPTEPRFALYAIGAAFFLASSAIVVEWIPAPKRWQTIVLWAEIVMASVLNWVGATYTPTGYMPILFNPIIVSIALVTDRRQLLYPVGALVGLLTLSNLPRLHLGDPYWYVDLGLYGALLLFAFSVGLLIRGFTEEKRRSEILLQQVNAAHAAVERANRQLRETAAQQQEMAKLAERQRLAREIHDSVAHGLTALIVQLQAGRRLAERAPESAAEHIVRCEQMARDALQETRRAVRALHPSGLEQQSDIEALTRLGRDYGLATGMVVQVEADQTARSLPPDAARLEQLYRIFQESLTNAHRHGAATRVTAHLSVDANRVSLRIGNNGQRPETMEPGIGLKSMSERARSLGGTIRFEHHSPDLTLCVELPLQQEDGQ